MPKKNIFIITIVLFLAVSCKNKNDPPNFIFILVDDLGWADIKCNYPGSFYDTPNIDKLAQAGIRFSQAYSANPVCSPTRAAIMTGKHPNRVDITDWIPGDDPKEKLLLGPQDRHELALEETTIAEKLKEKGYKNCFIGKWHLGNTGFFPEDQGFDINIGGHHKGSPPGGYYSPYNNPKLADGPEGEYLTDRLTNEGLQFINENKDDPFFLFLAYYTVHTPIQASVRHHHTYLAKRNELGIKEVSHRKEGDGWTKLIQENSEYASMVAAMDENVGRIVDVLSKTGLNRNTWLIFTSDNGGLSTLYRQNAPTSNGHLRAGKGWCYEGGIRVPLIITGPGIVNPGRVVDKPAVSMDFYTTILNLAGVGHNENDGEDLMPLLTGKGSVNREELFWHFPHYHGSAWKPGSALRKGDWKLVLFYEDSRTELFNLAQDPGETTDVSAEHPEQTEDLKRILFERLSETGAKFPVLNK